jgi:hypothetical protein
MSEMLERVAKAIGDENNWMKDDYRKEARAAIEAMRKPTQPMLQAAGDDWCEAETSWEIMIDAALIK